MKECQLATASDTKSVDTAAAAAAAAAVVPVTEDVAPSAGGDEMLVNALQKKYDALRDKLLLEVRTFDNEHFHYKTCQGNKVL